MGTAKRERQKANRQLKLEEIQKQEQTAKTKKRAIQIAVLLVVFLLGAWGLSKLVGGNDSTNVSADATTTVPGSSVPETTVAATATTAVPPSTVPGATITGETPCPAADGSSPRTITFEKAPPVCIDPAKTYTAAIDYEGFGTLNVKLDPVRAPKTVNNFVVLADYQYFDGTVCHRAIPQFVVQCGDPTAKGTGGPGYTFADELPKEGEYTVGSLAMANSGADTNGSQFFLITGPQGVALPPNYSLFGEALPGQEALIAKLDAAGNPDPAAGGVPPLQQIVINSITITEA